MNKNGLVLFLAVISMGVMADNNFSGPYAGFSIGYVKSQDQNMEFDRGILSGWSTKSTPDGSLLGLTVGYNKLLDNNILIGIESDFEYRNANDTGVYEKLGVPNPDYFIKTDVHNAASVRIRAGYLFNKEQTLLYITGGYARAKIERTYFDTSTAPFSQSITKSQNGWTAGIGLEHFVMERLSVQAKYRFSDYGNKIFNPNKIYLARFQEKQLYDEKSISIGIVYHF